MRLLCQTWVVWEEWVVWVCNTVPTKNKIQKGQFLLPFFFIYLNKKYEIVVTNRTIMTQIQFCLQDPG